VIDGIFVFDNVIHVYDLSTENLRTDVPDAEHARQVMMRPTFGGRVSSDQAGKRWSIDEMYALVFERSQTDMAMAQVVPIFDWYKDWFAPVKAQHAMAQAYPERVLFCGGVDPLYNGLADALSEMEHQVRDLGAVSMKFYNGHVDATWRCDDHELAYPLYEKCQELGVRVVQFHKGIPFGKQNVEHLGPTDLQKAARDFPDLEFIIHHLALPYFDETCSIAARFPNIHLALSGSISQMATAPRLLQERVGRLLREVGPHKLLWGSEAALVGCPQPYLELFMQLEIPEDLRIGYGYPQITRADKEAILGKNFARLMNVDLEAKRRQLAA
jgi:uncharacterized protein